jgi:hypothetical protein
VLKSMQLADDGGEYRGCAEWSYGSQLILLGAIFDHGVVELVVGRLRGLRQHALRSCTLEATNQWLSNRCSRNSRLRFLVDLPRQ